MDVYTKQCSLAVMGATLASGGVNPITGRQVGSPETARDTLSVLASCGMYERSGEWLFEIGLPAKSGVSGGIVAVAPGKGAIGVFSPRLDTAGNSIRGQRVCAHLSRTLGLNVFASASQTDTVHGPPEDLDVDAALVDCGMGLGANDAAELEALEQDAQREQKEPALAGASAGASPQTYMGAQALASALSTDLRWSANAPHARPDWGIRYGYTY